MVDLSLFGALSLALRALPNSHEAGLLAGASTSLVAAIPTARGLSHNHHLLLATIIFLSCSSSRGVFDALGNLPNLVIEFAFEFTNLSLILMHSVLQFVHAIIFSLFRA